MQYQNFCRFLSKPPVLGVQKRVVSKRVVLANVPRYQKPEQEYIRMFPSAKKGTFECSPVPKTGTRAQSPKPPFYETALLFPLDCFRQETKTPFSKTTVSTTLIYTTSNKQKGTLFATSTCAQRYTRAHLSIILRAVSGSVGASPDAWIESQTLLHKTRANQHNRLRLIRVACSSRSLKQALRAIPHKNPKLGIGRRAFL